jgi:hypothetical protein
MKRHKMNAMAILAAFGLLTATGGAYAADTADDKAGADAKGSSAKTVREESVDTVPAWQAFGSNDEEVLEETFFRLAQDFVGTSEIGVRRLGQVPIWPRGELKIGSVRVLPYLRESLEWETNVFRTPRTDRDSSNLTGSRSRAGRQSGWSWTNQAGILADTRLMGGRLRIALSADSRWQERFRSAQTDTWQMDSQLGASYRWSNGAWVRGGLSYTRRSDPIEIELAGSEFKRTTHNVFLTGGFDKDIFFGSKAKLEVGMRTRDVAPNSRDFKSVDRTETEFHAKASYPFWKKTTRVFARARYRRENRESHSLNDGDVIGLDFGIDGNFPILKGQHRGIRGSVSFGFDHAEYEDPSFTRGGRKFINTDDDDRNTNLAVRAALQYVISSRSTVDLRMLRTNQFSTFGNFQILDRVDLTYSRNITPRLTGRVSSFLEHTDPSGENPPNNLPGDARSPNRHMSRGGVGIGVRYKVNDWLDADLSYDYERRNAGVDRSYTNSRVVLGVTFYMSALRPKPRRERPK